ncbi:double zinc ribbon domain-containing protein [Sphingobium sp. CR28]|uniref:double zinc ribbon domain-containing protein n=1 Tax=Sphingobium sp. CR28 TaxID=3400272 RepID=UPI003FEFB686
MLGTLIGRLVALRPPWNKYQMHSMWAPNLRRAFAPVLDYALPARCPGCGEIVAEDDVFCVDCWSSLPFIAAPVCARCGIDLPDLAEDGAECGSCLAEPPPFGRVRAATRFEGVSRTLVHRLKYARRTGHARIMARHLVRLLPDEACDALLVPVPLHRWRIWSRGFNQSALIARALAGRTGLGIELDAVHRVKRTPPLYALGRAARQRAVRGAFAISKSGADKVRGRHVIIIDDVWTTGATATACVRVLLDAGASRVDVLCWARAMPGGAD